MKKSLLLCLTLFILLLSNRVYAEEVSKNKWSFKGTITPKYEFMVGDTVTGEDLEIDGVLTNGQVEIKSSDLLIYVSHAELDQPGNKTIKVYLSSKKDPRIENVEEINIVTNEFNATLIHPLEGKELEIDKIHWKSEDGFDTIRYSDNLNDAVTNIYGKPVSGTLNYSGNYAVPKLGYNTVKYRFTPSDERYEQKYGTFIVLYKTKPYMTIGKDYINVNIQIARYNLYLNGKKQTDNFIGNLKPNTNYKIVIKQKSTPKGKNVTIWSGTVKTKK